MEEKKVKIGVLGAGGIAAKFHLPEVEKLVGAEVTVVGGRKQSRLETLCQKYSIPRWTQNYDEILSDPEIDAVIIALPHTFHVEWAVKALKAGKHVFIEKPLYIDLKDADLLENVVRKSELSVLALPYVDRPHIFVTREWIQKGTLGTIASAHVRCGHGGPEKYYSGIHAIFGEPDNDEDLWFFDAEKAKVGALFDIGIYSITSLVAILGSVKEVMAKCTTMAKPTKLEDTASLILLFESGVLGTVETGWCDGARTNTFSVFGTEGKIAYNGIAQTLRHFIPCIPLNQPPQEKSYPIDISAFPDESPHQHWLSCIREKHQPTTSNVFNARHTTEIMLAALQSSEKGKIVAIKSKWSEVEGN